MSGNISGFFFYGWTTSARWNLIKEPRLRASTDCLRSMLIHQETIKESLEADPPCSPDSWTDYRVLCVCITSFLLPVNLLPSYKIHALLLSCCHCYSRGVKPYGITTVYLGEFNSRSLVSKSSNCFNRCWRAIIPNQGYLHPRGYFCRLSRRYMERLEIS